MFWSRYLKPENIVYKRFEGDMGVKFTNRCQPPVTPTVNRWENGHSQPSPMALKLIEAKLKELGERGEELLENYLAKSVN
ncbi:transcriptional regulator [Pleurocapsa sp. CCALA 161]|nr:transcriptional regulator [Pleurocapsa sp. CCALA 161]